MHNYFGKVIDVHSHFSHKEIPDRTLNGLPVNDGKLVNEDIKILQQEHLRMGVNKIAVSSFCSLYYQGEVEAENEYLKNLRKNSEGILQWVVVDPRNNATFSQAEKMIKEKGVLGIKIHSVMHKYNIHEYADKIFSWANEQNVTVLMHPDDKPFCAKLADKYANMNLIIAHLGDLEYIDVIKNSKHKNVYTDTSGMASYKNNIIEYAVEQIGSDRILFGTDTYSCAFQLGRIYFAGIGEQDKKNILFENATRLFEGKL